MLLMNKKVLLLNFQFRCSDGTEHEPGPSQVENTFSLADIITGAFPSARATGVITADGALQIGQ